MEDLALFGLTPLGVMDKGLDISRDNLFRPISAKYLASGTHDDDGGGGGGGVVVNDIHYFKFQDRHLEVVPFRQMYLRSTVIE